MIAQHQFLGMRIKIDLVPNIGHIEDLHVVLDQRERNNQGRKLPMKIAEHVCQFSLFVGAEPFLEMPNNMGSPRVTVGLFLDSALTEAGTPRRF